MNAPSCIDPEFVYAIHRLAPHARTNLFKDCRAEGALQECGWLITSNRITYPPWLRIPALHKKGAK